MTLYKYDGEQTLVFTGLSHDGHTLKAVPGETYDLDADPSDPRFSVVSAPKAVSSQPVVEPTTDSGGETPSSPPEPLETPNEKDVI
jgi:hypothetical protein